jgi:hypothetical protein
VGYIRPSPIQGNISFAATYSLVCSEEHTKLIESRDKFHWPRLLEQSVVTLSAEQLEWLLDGYDIWTQPHQMLRFTHAA